MELIFHLKFWVVPTSRVKMDQCCPQLRFFIVMVTLYKHYWCGSFGVMLCINCFRSFKTARPIDLFEELQYVAVANGTIAMYGPDFNIIDYYKSWTEQAGHPVLNVYVNHQTGMMTIYQVNMFIIIMNYIHIFTLFPTPFPLKGVGTTCCSSYCGEDSAIIFTTDRLPDFNPP
jgi:hypothetical protein